MPRPMSTYSHTQAGRDNATADRDKGRAPLWERIPQEWELHSDAFRKAYRAAWKAGERTSHE